MRYKVGTRVEVLTKKKVLSGVWRCAEVVAANRDSYTVRYFRSPNVAKEGVDKVPAEVVRPCPPPPADSMIWIVGETVEVLDGGYWKVSSIEADLGEGYYQIRVIGSIDEFRVKKSNIRERRELKENKWILMDQDICVTRTCKKTYVQQQGENHCQLVPDPASASKLLKRSPAESLSGAIKKQRAMEKEVNLDAYPSDAYSFCGKALPFAYPRGDISKYNAPVFTKTTVTSLLSNSVSTTSSVGSCSVIDVIPERVFSPSSAGCNQDKDPLWSDAESLLPVGVKAGVYFNQSKCEDAQRTHDLDLRSYRCILEALYASGPLSWEKELFLTNVRMKCYVSNDEHLSELRRLKCGGGLGLSCH